MSTTCIKLKEMSGSDLSALVTAVGQFNEANEPFETYVERLRLTFRVAKVEEDLQKEAFLAVVGPKTYGVIKDLVSPEKPTDKSLDELISVLERHLSPQPLVIAERFQFHNRVQGENEDVGAFTLALRKLSSTCDFGSFLDQALRDRFVCGLKDHSIQKKLLSEPKELTFSRAAEIAQGMEAAAKKARDLHGGHAPSGAQAHEEVHHMDKEKGSKKTGPCFRCGGENHQAANCKFKNAVCFKCNLKGHVAKKCRTKQTEKAGKKPRNAPTKQGMYELYSVSNTKKNPYEVKMKLNGKEVVMQLDTGAATTVITKKTYDENFAHEHLESSEVTLTGFSGTPIPVVGTMKVRARYQDQEHEVSVLVVDVEARRPNLMGRDWLELFKLDWSTINMLDDGIWTQYPEVFQKGKGPIKSFKVEIKLKPGASPCFHKTRNVPYAIKGKVNEELDRLVKEGVLKPVNSSEWASPVVTVVKPDGSLRLCGDYKVSVNKWAEVGTYPLPTVQDLFAKIKGKVFSKLDLSQAYLQCELTEESKKLLVINTSRGLLQPERLPYGVSQAPELFQKVMDQALQGLEGVLVYLDDILVASSSVEEHKKDLCKVMERLREYNITLNGTKCELFKRELNYLGHKITEEGIHPTEEKIQAIRNMKRPEDVKELQSMLGIVNFYRRFLPNLSTKLQPLNKLLQKEVCWKWTKDCEKVFQQLKTALTEKDVLVHYDGDKPLKLSCDASAYGLGAVISHVMKDGAERPIAFASRTMTSAEKNYAQVEREGLSIVFGLKKFHQYVYGRPFTLVTDHQALTNLLGPHTGVPPLAAARMQRWALMLAAYSYKIEYRRSDLHGNADALSRLVKGADGTEEGQVEEDEAVFSVVQDLPLTAQEIKEETRRDRTLGKVNECVMSGWESEDISDDMQPYYTRREELSVEDGCILWGRRVVIPPKFRAQLLQELHEEHPGVGRMKALARSYLWWPGLDGDIEAQVRSCTPCQVTRQDPAEAPLIPWEWPERVWQRVHLDFAEKGGQQFLLAVDSHSKWLEVFMMPDIKTGRTLDALRSMFARYGVPEVVVTDNGPTFTSAEFGDFMRMNGVRHKRTPPYHSASNGQVERCVRTLKESLSRSELSGEKRTLRHRLDNFLFAYRNTPHTVTGKTPAELFLRRAPRTRLSLLKPSLKPQVEKKQEQQKTSHDGKQPKLREFQSGQPVLVRNHRSDQRVTWVPGIIMCRKGPHTYLCRVHGRIRYVHVNHLRQDPSRQVDTEDDDREEPYPVLDRGQVASAAAVPEPELTNADEERRMTDGSDAGGDNPAATHPPPSPAPPVSPAPAVRRSGRPSRPPERLIEISAMAFG